MLYMFLHLIMISIFMYLILDVNKSCCDLCAFNNSVPIHNTWIKMYNNVNKTNNSIYQYIMCK